MNVKDNMKSVDLVVNKPATFKLLAACGHGQ